MTYSVSSLPSSISPGTLPASSSWASNGLYITDLPSSPPVVIPGPDPLCHAVSNMAASISHREIASWTFLLKCSSQTDFGPSIQTSSILQDYSDFTSNDAVIPENFVGVLNVGYPLRPSRAYLNLTGLGILADEHSDDLHNNLEDTDSITREHSHRACLPHFCFI
ncbi:hypothetical protein Ac2012v2_002777 [Leucoagaricus gongylophorus]